METHGGLFDADVASSVFAQPDSSVFHLPLARLAPQLETDLIDLGEARGTDRMAPALETTTRVDRLLASQPGGAGLGIRTSLSQGAESHRLGLMQLSVCGRIVKLRKIDVLRAHTCLVIGYLNEPLPDVLFVQSEIVERRIREAIRAGPLIVFAGEYTDQPGEGGLGRQSIGNGRRVTEQTYYRWRKEYGGLKVDQAKRLKELERENARLKRLMADAHLDNAILKEAARGN